MTNPTTIYNDKTDDVLVQPSAFRLPKPTISLIAAAATICVLGIVAIISPFFFSEIINVVLGCVMIGTGLTFAFHIFAWKKVSQRILVGLLSLLAIISGAIMLLHPLLGLYALSLTLGVYFLVEGGLKIFGFGRLSGVSYGMSLFSGIMSVILGVLILWIIPMDSTWIVGLLFGIDLFVGGVTLLSIFIAIKRIHKRAQSEKEAVGGNVD